MSSWLTGISIVAPDFWVAEATSVIRRFIYLKAISYEQGEKAIEDLFYLGVKTIPLDLQIFEWANRLKQSKIYDSIYVAVAEHLQAEFWTADKLQDKLVLCLYIGLVKVGCRDR